MKAVVVTTDYRLKDMCYRTVVRLPNGKHTTVYFPDEKAVGEIVVIKKQ